MRYFLEVAYHGKNYAGFQVQQNAITIQQQLEEALKTINKADIPLTGSSRTDAGVHARQNYFHFDTELMLGDKQVYSLNAILPQDIAVLSLRQVPADAHCRFDAQSRVYKYNLYQRKSPFLNDRAWYYPYPLNLEALNNVAALLLGKHDFTSFSKRNTQVKTMICTLLQSRWERRGDLWSYTVEGNRFLRGMVRGLVATMLQVGRGKTTEDAFVQIIEAKDCSKADFSAPGHGLVLEQVHFPEGYFSGKYS
jgi:tRNA pseudouridine38-40 synthase